MVLLITSIMAISNKDKILLLLEDYEEECYEYKIYYWNETYCTSSWDNSDWKNVNEERPCCSKESAGIRILENGTEQKIYWCFGFPYDKEFWKYTNECAKYHLVRSTELTPKE